MLVEELIAELTPYADKGVRVMLSSDSEGNSYEEVSVISEPLVWLRNHRELEILWDDDDTAELTEITPGLAEEIGCSPDNLFLGVGLWP